MSVTLSRGVNEKISLLVSEGADNLRVVSDFDRTLTKCFVNGVKLPSVFSLLRTSNLLHPDYIKKASLLFDYYHPFELDRSLSDSKRNKLMREWWQKHQQLFCDYKMSVDIINSVVKSNPKIFRDGADTFFKLLADNNVPLLILSAGLGDFIKQYLVENDWLTPNVFVASNFFEFDNNGFAVSYKSDVVTVTNKREFMADENYLRLASDRSNVILLGDSLDDLSMVESADTLLSVGFNNFGDKDYAGYYDVVLSCDESLSWINDLLMRIFA